MFTLALKDAANDFLMPQYATALSAAADLCSAANMVIAAQQRAKVPTGLVIAAVDMTRVPQHMIPALQIRARSGLAYRHGIMLTNGVGTIDADYREEICVLLSNTSPDPFTICQGDRIAQICAELIPRLHFTAAPTTRQGGFGSTGIK